MSILDEAAKLDADDPLRVFRGRFELPEGIIYLDGNSLGALPKATKARVAEVVEREWGQGLIRSWNAIDRGGADWIGAPQRIGAKIAPLIGAQLHEVIACDSVSVNLTKLIGAALTMNADNSGEGRKVVLSEPGNFPTDLYMVQGLQGQGMAEQRLAVRDSMIEALDPKNGGGDVALLMLTHVHYKTGAMFDMAALTEAAHDVGALVLWDLSHSGGAVPVDLNAAKADFAVGCGYKYLNGGPGAPAYAFVAERHHATFRQPITGWMGHAQPFAFSDKYEPAPGVSRMLAGTPPILAMSALESGVDLMAEIGMDRLVAKSRALSEFFRAAMAQYCPNMRCVSPTDPAQRGSQLSFHHAEAYAICQALIARGVIGDFRDPDILRFGFAPAYVSFADAARAVTALAEILDSGEWDAPEFRQRAAVT